MSADQTVAVVAYPAQRAARARAGDHRGQQRRRIGDPDRRPDGPFAWLAGRVISPA